MKRMIMLQGCICVMMMFMSMNAGLTDREALESAQIQEILRQERGGIIRGVHFKMPPEKVTSLERNIRCLHKQEERLTYAIKESSSATNELIQVQYDFDNRALHDVTVKSVQRDKIIAVKLFRNLKNHFDQIYGEAVPEQAGKMTWKGIDKTTGLSYNVTCELKDISIIINYSI